MQPPARIRSVLLSDRRIFKQGLFIMKTVRGTLPRLVFFAANLIFKSKFSPAMKHKDTFSFIVLFRDEKYQKSSKRAFPSL